jgi:hypothetical protein
MAGIFSILGRFAGTVIKSQTIEHALKTTTKYVISEMKLIDLRAKQALLHIKFQNHLQLLGRTVYRLINNNIDLQTSDHIKKIINVLNEIQQEIAAVQEELLKRKEKIDHENSSHKS